MSQLPSSDESDYEEEYEQTEKDGTPIMTDRSSALSGAASRRDNEPGSTLALSVQVDSPNMEECVDLNEVSAKLIQASESYISPIGKGPVFDYDEFKKSG